MQTKEDEVKLLIEYLLALAKIAQSGVVVNREIQATTEKIEQKLLN